MVSPDFLSRFPKTSFLKYHFNFKFCVPPHCENVWFPHLVWFAHLEARNRSQFRFVEVLHVSRNTQDCRLRHCSYTNCVTQLCNTKHQFEKHKKETWNKCLGFWEHAGLPTAALHNYVWWQCFCCTMHCTLHNGSVRTHCKAATLEWNSTWP